MSFSAFELLLPFLGQTLGSLLPFLGQTLGSLLPLLGPALGFSLFGKATFLGKALGFGQLCCGRRCGYYRGGWANSRRGNLRSRGFLAPSRQGPESQGSGSKDYRFHGLRH